MEHAPGPQSTQERLRMEAGYSTLYVSSVIRGLEKLWATHTVGLKP